MKYYATIVFVLLSMLAFGQHYNLVNDRFVNQQIESAIMLSESGMHTAFKPWRVSEVNKVIHHPDSAWNVNLPNKKFYSSRVGKKIFSEHLLQIDHKDYSLYLDPLFGFSGGKDQFTGRNTYDNSRGIQVMGSIGKSVSFYTSFWENQSVFVNYVDSFVRKNNVVPGQGRVKPFGDGGFDYAYAAGYVSIQPSKFFNLQFGNDKQFIGDGYRSLLLSDNAFNYPFAKITTNFWKIQYTNLFLAWQNIGNASNSGVGGYKQKFGTIHHLSYNVMQGLNIGLFEGIVWQGGDTTGMRRGFDPNYLNPIIFYRPVEFSRGSPDNVLIGLNIKAKLFKKYMFYGQILLDEFSLKEVKARSGWWANKQAFQLGYSFFNLFGIKNLNWQNELNVVRPYTYGHFTAEQSYTHYAQPLAHPLGANFIENVQFLRYRYRRFGIEAKVLMAQYGADSLKANGSFSNYGQNIFQGTAEIVGGPTEVPSIYGNTILQGVKNTLVFTDLNLSYLINPKTGLRISLNLSRRSQRTIFETRNTIWGFVTLSTLLPNRHYDF
jgi:hypothetical protein